MLKNLTNSMSEKILLSRERRREKKWSGGKEEKGTNLLLHRKQPHSGKLYSPYKAAVFIDTTTTKVFITNIISHSIFSFQLVDYFKCASD